MKVGKPVPSEREVDNDKGTGQCHGVLTWIDDTA